MSMCVGAVVVAGVRAPRCRLVPSDLRVFVCAQAWDMEFVKVDDETLFNLILAANYMEIKSLLDLTVSLCDPRPLLQPLPFT